MPVPSTHADALQLKVSGTEIQHLASVGTLRGVRVLSAAGRNGPGTGTLRAEGNGTLLSWQAPGSSAFGSAVLCDADGSYLLEDGDDRNLWVPIQVYVDHLPDGSEEASVHLQDVYAGGTSHDDVTAAEASAGDVTTYQVTLENTSDVTLGHLHVWIEKGLNAGFRDLFTIILHWWQSGASAHLIEISEDNANWYQPETEAAAVDFPDLAPGETDILYVRRTIGAAADSSAREELNIYISFTGV